MKVLVNRRNVLWMVGGGLTAATTNLSNFAFGADQKKMVVIHKIAGIPWVNLMKSGVEKGGKDYGVSATLIGPTTDDPALQAKLVEDVIAQKVDVLGIVPLDSNVLAPLLKRARDAGIIVLTLEGTNQPNRDFDVGMVDPIEYGETMMKRLAASMGEEGEYVVIVGGLTTPVHKLWADAAVAYQEKNYPKMSQATDRFGMGESTDETQKTVLDVMKAHPKVKGFLIYGSPGPIGAGNALRQIKNKKVTVIGTCTPGQAQTLINQGWINDCFLWNPVDSGYAMVAVAKQLLDGKKLNSGMEIPGVGSVVVTSNDTGGVLQLSKMLESTKDTTNGLVSQGL